MSGTRTRPAARDMARQPRTTMLTQREGRQRPPLPPHLRKLDQVGIPAIEHIPQSHGSSLQGRGAIRLGKVGARGPQPRSQSAVSRLALCPQRCKTPASTWGTLTGTQCGKEGAGCRHTEWTTPRPAGQPGGQEDTQAPPQCETIAKRNSASGGNSGQARDTGGRPPSAARATCATGTVTYIRRLPRV